MKIYSFVFFFKRLKYSFRCFLYFLMFKELLLYHLKIWFWSFIVKEEWKRCLFKIVLKEERKNFPTFFNWISMKNIHAFVLFKRLLWFKKIEMKRETWRKFFCFKFGFLICQIKKNNHEILWKGSFKIKKKWSTIVVEQSRKMNWIWCETIFSQRKTSFIWNSFNEKFTECINKSKLIKNLWKIMLS